MSLFSDFGSIAREFLEVKDEITKTVVDGASAAVGSLTDTRDDITSSLQSVADDVKAVQDDVRQSIAPVKDEIVDGAKSALDQLATKNDPQ